MDLLDTYSGSHGGAVKQAPDALLDRAVARVDAMNAVPQGKDYMLAIIKEAQNEELLEECIEEVTGEDPEDYTGETRIIFLSESEW